MKLYRAGDRSAGICEGCGGRVATRMEYRDYTPPGWDVAVPDVLVAACDHCGKVVGIPHQSTPRINEHRRPETTADVRVSVEARVPREIDEALDLATVALGASTRAMKPAMIRYYFGLVAHDPAVAEAVKAKSGGPRRGPSDRRIVVKLATGRWARVRKATRKAGIASTSALVRGVVLLAAEDCRIALEGRAGPADAASRRRLAFLRKLAGAI